MGNTCRSYWPTPPILGAIPVATIKTFIAAPSSEPCSPLRHKDTKKASEVFQHPDLVTWW